MKKSAMFIAILIGMIGMKSSLFGQNIYNQQTICNGCPCQTCPPSANNQPKGTPGPVKTEPPHCRHHKPWHQPGPPPKPKVIHDTVKIPAVVVDTPRVPCEITAFEPESDFAINGGTMTLMYRVKGTCEDRFFFTGAPTGSKVTIKKLQQLVVVGPLVIAGENSLTINTFDKVTGRKVSMTGVFGVNEPMATWAPDTQRYVPPPPPANINLATCCSGGLRHKKEAQFRLENYGERTGMGTFINWGDSKRCRTAAHYFFCRDLPIMILVDLAYCAGYHAAHGDHPVHTDNGDHTVEDTKWFLIKPHTGID